MQTQLVYPEPSARVAAKAGILLAALPTLWVLWEANWQAELTSLWPRILFIAAACWALACLVSVGYRHFNLDPQREGVAIVVFILATLLGVAVLLLGGIPLLII